MKVHNRSQNRIISRVSFWEDENEEEKEWEEGEEEEGRRRMMRRSQPVTLAVITPLSRADLKVAEFRRRVYASYVCNTMIWAVPR